MLRTGYFAASRQQDADCAAVILGSVSDGNTATSLTVPIDVPADCNLLILAVTARFAAASATISSMRVNGVDCEVIRPWTQNTNRPGVALYMVRNPAIGPGSAVLTFSRSTNSQMLTVYYVDGNVDIPLIQHDHVSSTSATSLNRTFTHGVARGPVIGAAIKTNPTGLGTWTLTNTVQQHTYGRNGEDSHVGSINEDPPEGDLTYTYQCNGSNSYMSLMQVELASKCARRGAITYLGSEDYRGASGANNMTIPVNIPADCDFLVVQPLLRYSGGTPSFTLSGCYIDDSSNPLVELAPAAIDGGRPLIGYLGFANPPAGAHNIRVQMSAAWYLNGSCVVHYLKGVDPDVPVAGYLSQIKATSPHTVTYNATPGNLLLVGCGAAMQNSAAAFVDPVPAHGDVRYTVNVWGSENLAAASVMFQAGLEAGDIAYGMTRTGTTDFGLNYALELQGRLTNG